MKNSSRNYNEKIYEMNRVVLRKNIYDEMISLIILISNYMEACV